MSIGLSFHCLPGFAMRSWKRFSCSSSLSDNQNLTRMIPDRTSARSISGQVRTKSSYSSAVQNPMTFSTPARLYQLRSNSTISPAGGQVRDVALEVPLRALALGRLVQRDDPAVAGVEPLDDPLDGPALAGGVAPLEDHDDPQALVADPLLQADQLDLQPLELLPRSSPS